MEVKPKNGDILKIYRGGYWHWAVYVGNDEVIHYSSKDSDKSLSNNKIVQESLTKFIREASKYEIVNFPEKYSGIRTSTKTQYGISSLMPQPRNSALDRNIVLELLEKNYKIYSPNEVVSRAKERLNEKEYSLISNNCEHFAVWCKTGISESRQVDFLLNILRATNPIFY